MLKQFWSKQRCLISCAYCSILIEILTVKMNHWLSSIQAGVSCLPDDENLSKLFMKKNCVVKIAKMAWLDEVSRRERGRKNATH